MKYNDLLSKDKGFLNLCINDANNNLWFILKDKREKLPGKDDILDIESYGTITKANENPVFVFLFRINKNNNLLYSYYINSNDTTGIRLLEQLVFQRIYYFSFVDIKNNSEIRKFYYINNLKEEIKKFLKILNKISSKDNIEVSFSKDYELKLFNKLYMKNLYKENILVR